MNSIHIISKLCIAVLGILPAPGCNSGSVTHEKKDITAHKSAEPVTIGSLLSEMTDRLEDTYLPEYTTAQYSSTDPRSVSPDKPFWFANEDGTGYVRMEDANTKVIFDQEGPGVITRIWTAGKITDRTFSFYFDGESVPRISLKGNDLTSLPWKPGSPLSFLHGHFDTKGGTSLYYPIPFSKSIKITVNVTADYGVAFHISYRRYPKGHKVDSFTLKDAGALEAESAEVAYLLQNPEPFTGGILCQDIKALSPGETMQLQLPEGTNAIRNLSIKLDKIDSGDYQSMMRRLLVRMHFDGEETVWAPLGDLSGGGIGARKVDNWYMKSNGKSEFVWRFAMPYRDSARISITNLDSSVKPVITIAANVDDSYVWCSNSAYFHASFNQERGLMTNNDYLSDNNREWTSVEIKGKGIMKADALSLYNDTATWYGEGDDKVYLDGESFPSFFGTGTEDYYNTSFAPVAEFQNAFGGAVRADSDNGSGYSTWLRTRPLDGISFNNSLKFNWELLGWKPSSLIMSSTVFWYGAPGASSGEPLGTYELKYLLP